MQSNFNNLNNSLIANFGREINLILFVYLFVTFFKKIFPPKEFFGTFIRCRFYRLGNGLKMKNACEQQWPNFNTAFWPRKLRPIVVGSKFN